MCVYDIHLGLWIVTRGLVINNGHEISVYICPITAHFLNNIKRRWDSEILDNRKIRA